MCIHRTIRNISLVIMVAEILCFEVITLYSISADQHYHIFTNQTELQTFQKVDKDGAMFVISAFVDKRRNANEIRLLGMTSVETTMLQCLIMYNQSAPDVVATPARVSIINRSYHHRYVSTFFICPICKGAFPTSVSLVTDDTLLEPQNVLHLVPSVSDELGEVKKHFITVCGSPLHSNYDDIERLIEWIELNQILGITHFIFYITDVSKRFQNTLEYYRVKGLVTLVKWPIADALEHASDINYYGQQVALNDCFYKYKHLTKYFTAIDTDEFIMPQIEGDRTLKHMLSRLPRASSYMFRHAALFSLNNDAERLKGGNLITAMSTSRAKHINRLRLRSKVLVFADDILSMGVHNTWSLRRGNTHLVDPEVGLLHHYRFEPVVKENTAPADLENPIKHIVSLKYVEELKGRIKTVVKDLNVIYKIAVKL